MTAARPEPDEHPLLVCVYYRVASADAGSVIPAVREFQRTLHGHVGLVDVQVLLRFELPNVAASAAPVSARSPAPSSGTPTASSRAATPPTPAADATLMETYRLALPAPAGSPAADAAVHAFLAALDDAASRIAGLLRSARHIELFAPCAS